MPRSSPAGTPADTSGETDERDQEGQAEQSGGWKAHEDGALTPCGTWRSRGEKGICPEWLEEASLNDACGAEPHPHPSSLPLTKASQGWLAARRLFSIQQD